jgi:ferrochelatase
MNLKSVGIVFVAHGEAETKSFSENYQVSRHTMAHAGEVMHLPPPVQVLISILGGIINTSKAVVSGFVSPHNQNTRLQARAIEGRLKSEQENLGVQFKFYTTFLSSQPYIESVFDEIVQNDYVIFISLSTIESRLSCGIVCHHMLDNQNKANILNLKMLSQHWKDLAFSALMINHIFGDRKFRSNPDQHKSLILVFHGTLVKDKDGKPPEFHSGLEETLEFADQLKQQITSDPRNFYGHVTVAYLNHEVGGTWTQPCLEKAIEELKTQEVNHIAIFPCGFLVDGSETLGHAKKVLANSGIDSPVYIPALNQEEAFMDYLSKRITTATQDYFEHQSALSEITV